MPGHVRTLKVILIAKDFLVNTYVALSDPNYFAAQRISRRLGPSTIERSPNLQKTNILYWLMIFNMSRTTTHKLDLMTRIIN